MTMLDRMRRHRGWLKWSLAIIVVAFVLVYVPQFLGPAATGSAMPNDVVATISGRKITANVLQRTYLQQLDQLRASSSQISEDLIRQLNIGPQILQRLINQEAQIAEAERQGLTVSDGELRERLVRLPMFQENGVFIGEDRYRQMLDSSRPPTRADEFEEELRQSLLAEKLQVAVTNWIRVSDAEVEQEYRRQNEKIKADLAVFNASNFRAGIAPTDAEIEAEFKKNPETYRVPEKRRVRYLSIDTAALRPTMTVTAQEIDARYRENMTQYQTPEQVRASHILFKTEGKDKAAVRKTAEGVLARVKAGGDFAALAKQYSEDEQSKVQGGDLNYFSQGAMVPEFDKVAWSLPVGQTSDLVESQYGFHIIRVVDKRAATTRTLDQVKPQIEDQLRDEKARARALTMSEEMAKEITGPADLDRVAKARGLTVGDSGLFARDEPLAGLGFAPTVAAQAFSLEVGKTSGAIATNQGHAFIALTEVKPSAIPSLADAKDKVRENVITARAVEVARSKAATLATTSGAGFAAAAKAAGAPVKSTELITRGSAYPEVGTSDAVDEAAFALKVGEVSKPVATETAVVVISVREKQDITPEGLAGARDNLKAQLTGERRQAFFAAYMAKAMKNMPVTYNEATIAQVLGN
jgi:peptidyl-prolyl cis-trans isomerase D